MIITMITMIDAKLLQQYAELTAAAKTIEKQIADVKEHIVGVMVTEDIKKIDSDFGTFILSERAVWEYSPQVELLEKNLKATKHQEQETGLAKAQTSRFLTFKP